MDVVPEYTCHQALKMSEKCIVSKGEAFSSTLEQSETISGLKSSITTEKTLMKTDRSEEQEENSFAAVYCNEENQKLEVKLESSPILLEEKSSPFNPPNQGLSFEDFILNPSAGSTRKPFKRLDPSSIEVKGVEEGLDSNAVARGMLEASETLAERMRVGISFFKDRVSASTRSPSSLPPSPSPSSGPSDEVREYVRGAREASAAASMLAGSLLRKVGTLVMDAGAPSEEEKKPEGAGLVGRALVQGVLNVSGAVSSSVSDLNSHVADEASSLITQKYGEGYGSVSRDALHTFGNVSSLRLVARPSSGLVMKVGREQMEGGGGEGKVESKEGDQVKEEVFVARDLPRMGKIRTVSQEA